MCHFQGLRAQFTEVLGTPFEGVRYCSVAFSDVDNDNDMDVLITGDGPAISGVNIAKLYLNDGSGMFTEVMNTPFTGVKSSSAAFADIDGDNDMDLLISGDDGDPITQLFTNDGVGNFTSVSGTLFEDVWLGSLAFSDIEDDGDMDVLLTGRNDGGLRIAKLYKNGGTGNFTEVIGTPFTGVESSTVSFADIDNDSDEDVLIIGWNKVENQITRLYVNDGVGNFSEVPGTPFEGVEDGSISFADVDNDNDLDVLITGIDKLDVTIARLYNNDGNGIFTEVLNTPFEGIEQGASAFFDMDNDGDQDLILTGKPNSTNTPVAILYANDGTGIFSEVSSTPFEGVWQSSLAIADVDNDSTLDVLISGINRFSTEVSKLYLNEIALSFGAEPLIENFSYYPNPTHGTINLSFFQSISHVQIRVRNMVGQLISEKGFSNLQSVEIAIPGPSGIYFVELISSNRRSIIKLKKE